MRHRLGAWTQEPAGTFTVHVGASGPYRLSVLGDGVRWHWLVAMDDDDLAEGTASTLADAMDAAEDAARQLPAH